MLAALALAVALESRGVIELELDGGPVEKRFVLRHPEEPSAWNGKLVIGAHGGSGGESFTRDGKVRGTDETALDDVIGDHALESGFAYASVDRDGIGGTREGLNLTRQFTDRIAERLRERLGRGVSRTYLVGLSMGGGIARYAAEESEPRYDGVLIIAGAHGDAETRRARQERIAALFPRVDPRVVKDPPESDLAAYAAAVGTPIEARRLWPFIGTSTRPAPAGEDTSGAVTVPVIEVVGTYDDFVLPEVLAYRSKVEARNAASRHRLYRVAGAWHISPEDDAISSFQFAGARLGLDEASLDAMATGASYLPAVREAFRTLDRWVVEGEAPPAGTLLARTVLLDGTLLDGTGAAPRPNAYVAWEGERIVAIGRASDYERRPDDEIVDAAGKWIVPGYVDTHVHLFDSGSLYTSPDDYDLTRFVPHEEERERIESKIEGTLERFLCAGVTTVASLGGPSWELDVAREASAPRVASAGPFLAGFPVGDLTLWTRDDPVLVPMSSPFAEGTTLSKAGINAGTAPAELEALVERARAEKRRVVVHAEELEAAKIAVRAGADVLAHTVVDALVDEELLELALERGAVSITGLAHFESYRAVLDERVSLLGIEERCGDPEVIATWDDLAEIPEGERPPLPPSIAWGSSSEGRAILQENVSRLHRAGIPIAVGTNGGNVGTLQGPSFHRELIALAEAGLPLGDVLVAATRNGALALGELDERGTLQTGKAADVLVLSRSPLETVESFAAVERVFVGGRDVTIRPRVPAEPMSYRGALWLEREDRAEEERPDLVLDALALEPGDVVADVGAGSGYYTRRIARRVAPDGKALAVDVQPEMLQLLRELADEEGIEGIETIASAPDDPRLPPKAVDWVLLADVYHEIASPAIVLSRMRESLAPGGRVALLEYRAEDGTGDHIKADHQMSVRQVLSEWKAAGFALVALNEILPSQHLFFFERGPSGRSLEDEDILSALAQGDVEAQAAAAGPEAVAVRIRNRTGEPLVVTAEAGLAFDGAPGGMVARRDAAIALADEGWREWRIRAVPTGYEAPSGPLTLRHSSLSHLMSVIQAGTYRSERGEIFYPARTPNVERAAVLLARFDPTYDEIRTVVDGSRVPARYAAAFGLLFCDLAGIDVTSKRIWKEAPVLFAQLRDRGLVDWYERTLGSLDLGGADDLARPGAHVLGDDAEVDPGLLEAPDVIAQVLLER
jgi:imidazolonepropionase-like amidohydrolase/SAM-dependent methyltransferase/pimeloyl-ACP methyl ester carboxylesterase